VKSTNSTDYGSNCVNLASDFHQFIKRLDDDGWVTTSRFTVPTWKMAHGNLHDCHSKPEYLSEDFRINHRADRIDLDFVENTTVKDFESAINITDFDAEHEVHEHIPAPGKQQPVRRVLPPGSITSNDVVGIRLFEKRGYFL
jgi:hypothetical protein